MVKLQRYSLLYEDFKKLYGQSLVAKIKYFVNKGWEEHPEIMGSSPLILAGMYMLTAAYITSARDHRPPRYFYGITIYRPDDPRVKTIRTDDTLRPERPRFSE